MMNWLVKVMLLYDVVTTCLSVPHLLVIRQVSDQDQIPAEILAQYPNGAFDDRKPPPDPNNQRFKEYVNELIRFDDWATGHGHVRSPQEVLPDDEFNDPNPHTDPNNPSYKDYVKELTRFDAWVTGQKVPIPADPVTDQLHQDIPADTLPSETAHTSVPRQVSQPDTQVPFDDHKPVIPPNQSFNDYVKVLTRFDAWVTGNKVPIPADPTTDALHQVFRRSVISPEQHFADQISDPAPANPASNPAYNSFVQELKRFDPWITGQKVPIPRDPVTDELHHIRRSLN
ncbi:hypothetical protein pipiens_011281 [Culex pipiens pipiens]|uniref:Uncharacterized protein n=1 Tax=Culex pipiens pipiens TaxID=38569 RepID=A0ABD1D8H8_CULPP